MKDAAKKLRKKMLRMLERKSKKFSLLRNWLNRKLLPRRRLRKKLLLKRKKLLPPKKSAKKPARKMEKRTRKQTRQTPVV